MKDRFSFEETDSGLRISTSEQCVVEFDDMLKELPSSDVETWKTAIELRGAGYSNSKIWEVPLRTRMRCSGYVSRPSLTSPNG
jgi:hypothetical protein